MRGKAQTTLLGNLTKDPETRQAGDKTLCEFSVAVNDGWGEKEHVSYFDVTAWGKTGENVAAYLTKGSPVLVFGRLQQDRWETEGNKRSKVQIVAEEVTFLGGKKSDDTPF